MGLSQSSSLKLNTLVDNLKRCLSLLENVFPLDISDNNKIQRERFWENVISCGGDPTKNPDLLAGYLEAKDRVNEWVFVDNIKENIDRSNTEDFLDDEEMRTSNIEINDYNEDTLFYELAVDERTRPICDIYGVRTLL